MKNLNVLISGASIAGPALAYWLNQYGFKTTIIEKSPTLREGGHAIDIRGMSREVVKRMGIMPQIQQAVTKTRGISFVNKDNKILAGMDAELFGGEGPISQFEILRGDLAEILYAITKNTTEYIFDDTISAIQQDTDGVTVAFQKAAPRKFDLVFGADGLHSNVRALVFGEESKFIQNLGYYLAICSAPSPVELNHRELAYNIPGKVAAIYPCKKPGEAKLMFNFTSPPLQYDRHDITQQKQILANVFSGAGWVVPQMLQEMWKAPDFYFDTMSLVRMDSWSKGRVTLVGDAGYCPSPLTGQGTNLALVGAYILAGELKAAEGDYQTAFAVYEKEMRDYVEQNQKTAERNGKGFMPPSNFKIWLRNTNIRMLPHLPWKGLIEKMMLKTPILDLKDYAALPQLASASTSPL